jgi:hypothetical protein
VPGETEADASLCRCGIKASLPSFSSAEAGWVELIDICIGKRRFVALKCASKLFGHFRSLSLKPLIETLGADEVPSEIV